MLDHDVKSSDEELMVYCIYTINAANTLDIASVRSIASLIQICLAMRLTKQKRALGNDLTWMGTCLPWKQ